MTPVQNGEIAFADNLLHLDRRVGELQGRIAILLSAPRVETRDVNQAGIRQPVERFQELRQGRERLEIRKNPPAAPRRPARRLAHPAAPDAPILGIRAAVVRIQLAKGHEKILVEPLRAYPTTVSGEGDSPLLLRDHRGGGARRKM